MNIIKVQILIWFSRSVEFLFEFYLKDVDSYIYIDMDFYFIKLGILFVIFYMFMCGFFIIQKIYFEIKYLVQKLMFFYFLVYV